MTSAPETERPESSEPSESPEAPAAESPARPAAARAARRADGAPGGAVRAGAAVRAGVGERADGQLAEGPGPPGAHAAQPHRVPAAGARRHGHLRGRPAGAGGGPDRSGGGGRPGHRRADLAAGGGRGPGRHGSAATVCRCGRWAACSSTTRWPGRARTRSPAAARACPEYQGATPDPLDPTVPDLTPAGRSGRRRAHRVARRHRAGPRHRAAAAERRHAHHVRHRRRAGGAAGDPRRRRRVHQQPHLQQAGADRVAGGVAAGHGGAARRGWTAGRSGRRGRDGSAGRGSSTPWCPW